TAAARDALAFGTGAVAAADRAVQIGHGTNRTPASIQYLDERLATAAELRGVSTAANAAVSGVAGVQADLNAHRTDTTRHVTAADKARWNAMVATSHVGDVDVAGTLAVRELTSRPDEKIFVSGSVIIDDIANLECLVGRRTNDFVNVIWNEFVYSDKLSDWLDVAFADILCEGNPDRWEGSDVVWGLSHIDQSYYDDYRFNPLASFALPLYATTNAVNALAARLAALEMTLHSLTNAAAAQ
ncbi:MAG: hypothetical protein IJ783_04900, partial [Kiritimatiellae bacterium]|nr:hypothetical protein [Kiritimatiellia bacterium]